jgi:sialic acid synthase SpsE/sugar phosphate isomerase/epimerase
MSARVIAELGINHDGDLEKASKLISASQESGCAGVKFQYRNLDRAYSFDKTRLSPGNSEIGDEIVRAEVFRNHLSPKEISELAGFAKKIGLEVGISFFIEEDFDDFTELEHELFDFYKIPSAELLNIGLIQKLLDTSKSVLISLGMHSEEEITGVLERIKSNPNWIPMHCVSNYPVATHNARLGYISYLRDKWKRPVGYSSHDLNWESSILALGLGATVIERHMTLDKQAAGLDHSSSSTPDEFSKLAQFASGHELMSIGNGPRLSNQGELLNRQNLGRSFFARKTLPAGSQIYRSDFEYTSPMTGIDYQTFHFFEGKPLVKKLSQGGVLTMGHLETRDVELTDIEVDFAKKQKLSVPVRLGDFALVSTEIPIDSFEFHLSFEEVFGNSQFVNVKPGQNFSVHSPDYIDSQNLIDPFSEDQRVKAKSLECLEHVIAFAENLSRKSGNSVPIVNSLSSRTLSREMFYSRIRELFSSLSTDNTPMTIQWLPPFAWYFGGSIRLEQLNSESDVEFLKKFEIPVTMDSSHLIMCRNFDGLDATSVIRELKDQILHCHISDAEGIDGEGTGFEDFTGKNFDIFSSLFALDTQRVIEVWQGHLNGNEGFKSAIRQLSKSL